MQRTLFALGFAMITLSACGNPAASKVEVGPAIPGPYVETATPVGPSSVDTTPIPMENAPPWQTTPGPIPVEFRHVWAIERKDCTAEPALTRISIAPSAIRFYEGHAVVVTANTSLEGTAALEVDHTSEGATNREAHTLALNPTKKTLNYDRNGEAFTYVRCD